MVEGGGIRGLVHTAIGVGEQDGDERVCSPGVLDDAGPKAQGDDAGQSPDILHHGEEGSLVAPLRETRDDD